MTPTQRIFAAVVAFLLLIFVIDSIRRRRLEIQYAILWMIVAAGIVLLATWYSLLENVSRLIGAALPTTTLFLFGILILVLINIQFSMRISQLQTRLRLLAQEHALLFQQLARHKEKDKENGDPSA